MQTSTSKKIVRLCFLSTSVPLAGGYLIHTSLDLFIPIVAWVLAGTIAGVIFHFLNQLRKSVAQYEAEIFAQYKNDIEQSKEALEQTLEDDSVFTLETDNQEATAAECFEEVFQKTNTEHYDQENAEISEGVITRSETLQNHEDHTPKQNALTIDYLVRRCQHAMMLIDSDRNILNINKALLEILNQTEIPSHEWAGRTIDDLIELQDEHLKTLLNEALKSGQKVRFVQENQPSSDWTLTPLRANHENTGYLIEVTSPSKNERISLEEGLAQTNNKLKQTEHEMASFINSMVETGLYYQKKGTVGKKLPSTDFEHPVIKKGANTLNQLSTLISDMHLEINELKQSIQSQIQNPKLSANQTSVLTQAILRNLEDLKREYYGLVQNQQEHLKIVNEQKGITQSLSAQLEKGVHLSKSCRDKTIAGFETITIILQNLHQFEQHLSLMLKILDKTTKNIKKKSMDQALSKSLEVFMQSLTDQIKQATLLAQRNKHRLNILIPSYAGHHYQIGHLQTQWQSCQDLIETQTISMAQWRTYQQKLNQTEEILNERMDELTHLSEKMLRKTLLAESNASKSKINLNQFNEIIYNASVDEESDSDGLPKEKS